MQPFVIPIKGLKEGTTEFEWHADREFFESFENSEILDASLEILVRVVNEDFTIEAQCEIDGTVTVSCDRCLGDLVLPVSASFEEGGTLDLTQDIYDYVMLSLPIVRMHEEGECDEETVKYLSK